jgi:hypothetical protein
MILKTLPPSTSPRTHERHANEGGNRVRARVNAVRHHRDDVRLVQDGAGVPTATRCRMTMNISGIDLWMRLPTVR